MKNGEVISGAEIMREGLMVDEREHHPLPDPPRVKLPWLRTSGPAAEAPPVAEAEGEPVSTALREFLAEGVDVGRASTEAAFRRRHGIDADEDLTPATVEAAIRRRAEERRKAVDPFDFA